MSALTPSPRESAAWPRARLGSFPFEDMMKLFTHGSHLRKNFCTIIRSEISWFAAEYVCVAKRGENRDHAYSHENCDGSNS